MAQIKKITNLGKIKAFGHDNLEVENVKFTGEIAKRKVKGGLRDAFICPEGYVWLTGDYCVVPETLVSTPDGEVQIKNLKESQLVNTPFGPKKCKNVRYTGVHKKIKIKLNSGETLICSPEHRVAVNRDGTNLWIMAKNLRTDDYILSQNEPGFRGLKGTNIESIEFLDESCEMMDIEVDDVHCFYANGILVHNCAQEMRLMGNFSGENNLIEPILKGNDIHNYIAKQMFGFEDPSHRSAVKVLNFATAYGANEYTISRKLNVPVPEAKSLLDRYYATMAQLTRWKQEVIKEGRRKGMVFTYFGRPRLVYKYYNSSDRQLHAFADRTCCNSPVQGCTPLDGYLETAEGVVVMGKNLGKRLNAKEGVLIPSHRGNNEPILCIFNTGDFMVCDINHKFITGTMEDPIIAELRKGLRFKGKRQSVLLSPLHKKIVKLSKYIFKSTTECLALLKSRCRNEEFIAKGDKDITSCFIKLALSNRWFNYDYDFLIKIRSLASVYGFNVIYSSKKDKLKVTWTRRKSCKLAYCKSILDEGVTVEVGSCTVVNGFQMYPNQGFMNKNTGGDIIRMKLVQLTELFKTDKEFAENVQFACTVHDEINLYVKKDYAKKAFDILKNLMTFAPSNFKVPIVADLGVGTSWGDIVDCSSMSEDNKIKLPEYD